TGALGSAGVTSTSTGPAATGALSSSDSPCALAAIASVSPLASSSRADSPPFAVSGAPGPRSTIKRPLAGTSTRYQSAQSPSSHSSVSAWRWSGGSGRGPAGWASRSGGGFAQAPSAAASRSAGAARRAVTLAPEGRRRRLVRDRAHVGPRHQAVAHVHLAALGPLDAPLVHVAARDAALLQELRQRERAAPLARDLDLARVRDRPQPSARRAPPAGGAPVEGLCAGALGV